MTRPRLSTGLSLLLLLCLATAQVCGCLGYDPTPAPAARLRFALDLPATATAQVVVLDENGLEVGQTEASGGAQVELTLTPGRDFPSVRLVATAGERVLKAIAAQVALDATTDMGQIDAKSTAAAQLVQHKVAGQGGAFSSVPESTVADLVRQVGQGGAEIEAYTALVTQLLAAARPDGSAPPLFAVDDALLDSGFAQAREAALPKDAQLDYQNKLAAATSQLTLSLICDAAFVKVMFTVDVSGEGLDGNGNPQLIRQPTKEGKVFLAITVDDSSEIADSQGLLKNQMTPNDPETVMFDDGTGGDEDAGDGIFTRVLVLPRGMRVKYKYTNGSAGEGWTRTEEWPGNARLLEVRDVLSRHSDGSPDCLVIRRDVFGDEATNKNNVNLHTKIKASGGTLSFDQDLGGASAAKVADDRYVGGLQRAQTREVPPLTPLGLPEARENGSCTRCPAPLTVSADDHVAPELLAAEFTSTSRVRVSFSEAMEFASASNPHNFIIVDAAGQALPITGVAPAGSLVTLDVLAPDFGQSYTLHVKQLKDASANNNPLGAEGASVAIGRDRTPPQLLEAQALPLRDLNPAASGADPKVGQVVRLTFDEELDPLTAENSANYTIEGLAGGDLQVLSARLTAPTQVHLVTGEQGRRKPYALTVAGVQDLGGNRIKVGDPLRFTGFALYEVNFTAVPGFALLDLQGNQRGLPAGEKLYLTGTVLAVARNLDGERIGVAGRTDVTGVPQFEMQPTGQLYKGEPVYGIRLLAPAGTYAWKVAHGVAGEYTDPPPTLVKVHKSLCTTNDATGVNIDPATLTALPLPGADGKPVSFLDYAEANLSRTGNDTPGPFLPQQGQSLPKPSVMFKRENPDEVCTVNRDDAPCPGIVVGTWRDIADFVVGDKTEDYDDGLPEVAPTRLAQDTEAPGIQALTVRDSESLLISFDERVTVDQGTLTLGAAQSKSGAPLTVALEAAGSIGSALLPHQLLLRTGRMDNGAPYQLTLEGVRDVFGNQLPTPLTASWVAPQAYTPFTPLADNTPPKVLSVLPKTPTSLLVQFDEKIRPADATTENFTITATGAAGPQVLSATLQGGGSAVLLSTELQSPQAPYTLVVSNVGDMATPTNLLTEQQVAFKGFGDSTPPQLVHGAAIASTTIALAFDEPLSAVAAMAQSSYSISDGVSVQQVAFSGDPTLKAAAFDPSGAPFADNVVLLTVSPLPVGKAVTVTPAGVTDLSGNPCGSTVQITGVSAPPTVDVLLTYTVSQSETAAGKIPARAISTATLAAQREGIFLLGCTVSADGTTKGDPNSPINVQLGFFPPEGQPLDGPEPQLRDDGQQGDETAGDGVFSLLVKGVPLGTSLQWKAFAPYTVAYKSANPGDAQAAFADATPGPAVFSDGQEFPGNENGIRILGDANGDGLVRINALFGDESSFKKYTNTPPFVWVVDDVKWTP